MPKLAKCHLGVIGWQSRKSLLSSSRDPRDPKIGVSPDPSLPTTKQRPQMFLRPSVGNDSSQYGRVEGAVSGCRPAGPQNVGQVVSICLVCSHLSLFLPLSLHNVIFLTFFQCRLLCCFVFVCCCCVFVLSVCHVSHTLRFILHEFQVLITIELLNCF